MGKPEHPTSQSPGVGPERTEDIKAIHQNGQLLNYCQAILDHELDATSEGYRLAGILRLMQSSIPTASRNRSLKRRALMNTNLDKDR